MKRIFITASVLLAPLNNAYAGCSAASFAACSSLATSTGSRPRPSHWPGWAGLGWAGQSPFSNPVGNHNVLLTHERLRVRCENLHAAHRFIDPTQGIFK